MDRSTSATASIRFADALTSSCPSVELLENLRFHPGEEDNDPAFGASLVEGFDYYVNEAFSASHRAHASIMIPPTLVPSAGRAELLREVSRCSDCWRHPTRPFVAITAAPRWPTSSRS